MRLPIAQLLSRAIRSTRAMSSPAIEAYRAILSTIDLSKYDPEQSRLMDERCILIDEQDRPLGAADKKTCKPGRTSLSFAGFTVL